MLQHLQGFRGLAFAFLLFPGWTQAAWVQFDPQDTTKVPKRFSETGFYSNMGAKTVTPEAVPFDVNTPLWSDHAAKSRWIILNPASSTKVFFQPDSDYYEYPNGTVFVKLFQQDTISGNPASRMHWETRVMVNKRAFDSANNRVHDMWYPFSYRWNRAGTEAFLVPETGLDTALTVWAGGRKSFRKWTFPSVSGCNNCHRKYNGYAQGRAILGFFTPQLNRPSSANPSLNQITQLFQRGVLHWSKPTPTTEDVAKLAKWARIEDESADLDLRARAYVASNCSGCHGARGKLTNAFGHATELNFDYFRLSGAAVQPEMEYRHKRVRFFEEMPSLTVDGMVIEQALVVPGYPELSALLYRMKSRNGSQPTEDTAFNATQNQMPPLGVFEEDTVATRVLARWIKSMPELVSVRKGLPSAAISLDRRGNILSFPAPTQVQPDLVGLDGRRYSLLPLSETRFRLPAGLPSGLYMVRSGPRYFKLLL